MVTYIYLFLGLEEVASIVQFRAMELHEIKALAARQDVEFNIGMYFIEKKDGTPITSGNFYAEK